VARGPDCVLRALRLPALRSLGELADRAPVVVVDTREQEPLAFERLTSVRGTLQTGDYSVAGLQDLFSIERKTVSDLVGCCMGENRERFERELHRLRGYRFKRLLVVGSEAEILAGSTTRTSTPTPCWPACARSRRGTISRSCLYRRPRPAPV
jgi:ERCC4-type nuclease